MATIAGALRFGTKCSTPPAKAEVAAPRIQRPATIRGFNGSSVNRILAKAIAAPIHANRIGITMIWYNFIFPST